MSPQTALDKTPSWFRNLILNGLITIVSVVGFEYIKSNFIDKRTEATSTHPNYVVTMSSDQVDRFLAALDTFAIAQRDMAQSLRVTRLDVSDIKNKLQQHVEDVASFSTSQGSVRGHDDLRQVR